MIAFQICDLWVARDKNGDLGLYQGLPSWDPEKGIWCGICFNLPKKKCPELTPESEPIQVTVSVLEDSFPDSLLLPF